MELEKIRKLVNLSKFDICHEKCAFDPFRLIYISKAGSRKVNLFKTLITSSCSFDCRYCGNAWNKGVKATPQEIYKAFKLLKEKGFVSGAFISNAINDPEKSMEEILEVGEMIRKENPSYIHLKIVPGASRDQVKRAAEIANRISVNIETPSKSVFGEICSVKTKEDILRRLRWGLKEAKKRGKSFSTQMIVGIGENDEQILKVAEKLYRSGVKRVYYSGFTPVKGTPMESLKAEERGRVVNLYRADALLRIYGYSFKDLREALTDGFLPKEDPKLVLALRKRELKAIEIPGVGKKIAKLLEKGYTLGEIKRMGYSVKRISAFVNQRRLHEFSTE